VSVSETDILSHLFSAMLMLLQISRSIYCWTEIHGEARNEPYPWNSYVIHLPEQDIVALVDPLTMSSEISDEIESIGKPTHIILTCEYHLRESVRYRDRWGCKILANCNEIDKYEVDIDGGFRAGQQLFGCIGLVDVKGSFYSETALLFREKGGILIIGDLISGGRMDGGIPDGELGIPFPEYLPDVLSTRESLRNLLGLEFSAICSGHGTPVLENAKSKLEAFAESDHVWEALENTRKLRGVKEAD
jgi:hypothetical protein